MKKILVLIGALAVFTGAAFAVNLLTHTDKKGKFTIQYPQGWKKKLNKGGINASFTTKDNLASVQVIHSPENSGKKADALLQEIESHMGGTHVNQLPEDKRHAKGDDLAKMNAEEAAAGYYDLDHEGHKIHQFIMVARKGQEDYIVIVTYADQASGEYGDLAVQIADSLHILD
jgi:hypothetical protein